MHYGANAQDDFEGALQQHKTLREPLELAFDQTVGSDGYDGKIDASAQTSPKKM